MRRSDSLEGGSPCARGSPAIHNSSGAVVGSFGMGEGATLPSANKLKVKVGKAAVDRCFACSSESRRFVVPLGGGRSWAGVLRSAPWRGVSDSDWAVELESESVFAVAASHSSSSLASVSVDPEAGCQPTTVTARQPNSGGNHPVAFRLLTCGLGVFDTISPKKRWFC